MRPPLYFDGEPNTFAQMKKLFPEVSTLKVRYPKTEYGCVARRAGDHRENQPPEPERTKR